MKDKNLSKSKFCKLCGFGMTTLNKIMNDDYSIHIDVLGKLSKTMNVEIKDLFTKQK
ncbi:MAG: helix-turn-helix transcriptional regulator [Clostridia bacterium]|nr:helix-turn-helix transcriptional regulator [Clostridia bacterium]